MKKGNYLSLGISSLHRELTTLRRLHEKTGEPLPQKSSSRSSDANVDETSAENYGRSTMLVEDENIPDATGKIWSPPTDGNFSSSGRRYENSAWYNPDALRSAISTTRAN